ncbi:MAG: hypothetical protein LBN27_06230 [Prevotellaceae bacterium]|jgi:hypothetical protein|nr:hypothetical protein [Prevotellaceae bacterium]
MTTEWIPKSYEALYNLATQAKTYIQGNMGDLGINGKTAEWVNVSYINNTYIPYSNDYLAWLNPATRTPLMITAIQASYKALVPMTRELYGFMKANPVVTDENLQAMGFPKRSTGSHTPVPPPATVPEATVELPSEGVVRIHYRDKDSNKRGKPKGVHCVEIAWIVAETPVLQWDGLINSAVDTATPYTFSFPSELRGKTLSFALRWENTKGEKGAWSPVYTALIP